jgi:hypothetical protein
MSKTRYAFALLSSVGLSEAAASMKTSIAKALGLGVIAAVCAGAMMAPAAHATELVGTWIDPLNGFIDSFTVQSTGGYADPAGGDYIDFALTGDVNGFNAIAFGDAAANGYAAIGFANSGGVNAFFYDLLSPPVFNGTVTGFVLQPGFYFSNAYGSTLELAPASAVPEPDAWALMIAGAALAGGAWRVARRRPRSSVTASSRPAIA